MAAPAGAVVSIYLDVQRTVEVADEVETRTGRRYEVVTVRQQTRGRHVGRWHLRCQVLAPDHPRDPDVTVHRIWWYSRG